MHGYISLRFTLKNVCWWILILFLTFKIGTECHLIFTGVFDPYESRYAKFSDVDRLTMREEARRMFQFAYDNYMRYAFPLDELDPIHCVGRGPDYENPSNININDVLGDYCLGLLDSLTTLVVMGNKSEFQKAVRNVLEFVSFEKDNTVQVFEATIRVLGALLSAHMIIVDPQKTLGDYSLPDYNDDLLHLAHDLADRLLPAFDNTNTGIPYPRINLMYGVPYNTINETCTSGAGSLLLEFGVLSRLLGDPTFEGLARRTNKAIWNLRDNDTGLLGNVLDIQTGEWVGLLSGLGAGLDSYYEYLLKSYILFGDIDDYKMFNESYVKIKGYLRRGRDHCNAGEGEHPIYVNVHMRDGSTANTWIDALQASFAGVQLFHSDFEWRCRGSHLPTRTVLHHLEEVWRFARKVQLAVEVETTVLHTVRGSAFIKEDFRAPDVAFYPLRPEFAESTYLLYMTTKNPFYLHVGKEIIENLNSFTKVACGYATIHNVQDKTLEDRMESFFLSETCKYLYLLFDKENPVNKKYGNYIFTTEGHMFPIDPQFRDWPLFSQDTSQTTDSSQTTEPSTGSDHYVNWIRPSTMEEEVEQNKRSSETDQEEVVTDEEPVVITSTTKKNSTWTNNDPHCNAFPFPNRFTLPLRSQYLQQLYKSIGYKDDLSIEIIDQC